VTERVVASDSSSVSKPTSEAFGHYSPPPDTFDEYFRADDTLQPAIDKVLYGLGSLEPDGLERKRVLADSSFVQGGVTFSVYSDSRGVEKIFPFDLMPRPVDPASWKHVERGLRQRVVALNAFIADIYGAQRVLRDGVVDRELVESCSGYIPAVRGIRPPGGVYVHISGIDLVRDGQGVFRVLEDNLRCPSGVSYVLENRAVMKRAFPRAFEKLNVLPVEAYPVKLREAMTALSPRGYDRPVILTPGPFNSAYFEHGFLARRSGTELVQGSDLEVIDERVYVKTTHGLQHVDVIYRRIDDLFLDPRVFRSDSMLGVPGLLGAYAAGNVTLMNAIGNGVADDKAIYPYVHDLIRYYLNEDPILEQVTTWRCRNPRELSHVLANLKQLVVKRVDGAGGYGMLVGPTASTRECEEFASVLRASPEAYVAQPLVELSTCPVWDGRHMVPRRVDLRPYIIMSDDDPWVLPGGLTRVALKEGSYVVNSSQGGGSKDTWVLGGEA
jgi:uncharacterized circularly permuted ATP-grasp superfamily protein